MNLIRPPPPLGAYEGALHLKILRSNGGRGKTEIYVSMLNFFKYYNLK